MALRLAAQAARALSVAGDLTHVDLVANVRFPGPKANGIQIAAMAQALSDTGLTVDVVVPRRFGHEPGDPWTHYGVRRSFGVQRVASFDLIDLLPTSAQRLPFLMQSLTFALRALARAAVTRDAGVFVRDHYTLSVLASGLRPEDLQRISAEVHNLPGDAGRRRRVTRLLARLPAVVTISEGLRQDLIGEGLEPERILTAHDGVHLARYAGLPEAPVARAELQLPNELPLIVYAGQLYTWKGVDTLVAALQHLPQARLLVVGGDAQNLPRIEAAVQRHAPGRVHLAGLVPPGDVPFHLAAADVIVLPNTAKEEISARYTSPLKLFEAMASRRAIVASDVPSLGEVLTHDQNAWLVAPDDPVALAEGLEVVLSDEARRARLAAQAWEDVQACDWTARGQAVASFLRTRLRMGGS